MTEKRKGVVVITGASAGIGRACVRKFAKEGYDVSLIARGEDGLKAAQKEVEELGRKAIYNLVDVADAEAMELAAERTEAELGPIEIWVNNAMTSVFSPVNKMKPIEYKRVTEVTYLGQVYGALAALKHMQARDKGSIVFVGSALGYRGIPLQSAYCASKHAIEGFYDSLRTELMHDKSNVKIAIAELPALNTTQFGFVKTRLPNKPRPMGTIYQPEVAADGIYFSAHHKRRDVKIGFSTFTTILGNKIAPWYADYVLSKSGIKGQQTDQPEDPNRKYNLWEPLPGDHGSHGEFDDEAKSSSVQLWIAKNKMVLYSALAIILSVIFVLVLIF